MAGDILVELAAAGDRAAFEALVRQHQSPLRGFLRRLTRGDHALADDLAQETFFEAWRKIGQFRREGPFRGWLTSIAWRRYLMTARRRKLEPPEAGVEPAAPPSTSDLRLDLEKAMALLSLPQRAALTICFALDYTHEEAAEILGMPLGTLKSHVSRGRETMHKLLEGA
jgi:RNA polymerase sigma-70 factor (ECF subfamily)